MGASRNTTSSGTPTGAVDMSKADNDKMLQQLELLRNSYDARIRDLRFASQSAKDMWANRRDAADRIIAFGGVPRTTAGYAADALFETLPYGTTVEISGSVPSANGTWIKGANLSGDRQQMWTKLTDGDGSPSNPSHTSASQLNLMGSHDDGFKMRIKKMG